MRYLMALDAGTGSIRAVIFDTKGNQISLASKEWTHIAEPNVPNSMTFDLEENWDLVVMCIKKALKRANLKGKDIISLSASSMREGIVVYDKDKKPIWGVANVDARADKEVKYIRKNYPKLEKEFYKTSGQTFALGALPRLMWLKNNRANIYDKVAYISMIGDWILYKLCGVIASDPSNGGTSGIFSLKKRDWDREMPKKLGLKDNIFPKALECGTLMGRVTKKASKDTNLSTKTKVVMGGGDVQMGALGLGVVDVGDVAILGGSFWQQIVNIPKDTPPPKDMSIRVNPHTISNLNQAEGITFFSGLVMRWFRDAFCEEEKKLAKEKGIDTYQLLEERAKDVPIGSNGIIPIFSDSMKYAKWYHASPSFLNLSLDPTKSNKASIFKSLQENACIVSNINLKKIEKWTDIKVKEIVFASGASKGELWCQTLSDVTGVIIKVPKVKEATSLGVAICAGVGANIYPNLKQTSKSLIEWDKTYYPNSKNHKKYKQISKKWTKIYKEQLKLVDKNLTTSMWKAVGI